jgi:ABC-type molybdate transport system substrate-binding protein
MRLAARLGLIMVLLLGGAACTDEGRPPEMSGTLTIYASTSLTEVFTSMANGFSTTYPAVRVNLTFGPDSDLAQRAAAGPAPDLIALEGPASMAAAGPTGTPVRFARNQLVLAIPADNPEGPARPDRPQPLRRTARPMRRIGALRYGRRHRARRGSGACARDGHPGGGRALGHDAAARRPR